MERNFDDVVALFKARAEHTSNTTIKKELIQNALLYVVSSMMGMNRVNIMKYGSSVAKPANFFGLVLAPSGYGKDLSLHVVEHAFRKYTDVYQDRVKENFEVNHAIMPNGIQLDEPQHIVPRDYKVELRGSIEGIMRVANYFDGATIGSLNVVSTEFGGELDQDNLTILTKLWQEGKNGGSTNVNEKYPPVNNVQTNILLFGSQPDFISNKAKHDILATKIKAGLARRSIFVYVEHERSEPINTEIEVSEAELEAIADGVIETLKRLEQTSGSSYLITDDCQAIIQEYRNEKIAEYNIKLNDITNAAKSTPDVVERLSAIIAVIEGDVNIRPNHVRKAIEIVENSLEAVQKFIEPPRHYRTMFKVLRNDLERKKGIPDFEQEGVTFRNKSEQEYHIEQLYGLASYYGYEIEEKNHQFIMRKPKENDLRKIVVGVGVPGASKPEATTEFASHIVPFFNRDARTDHSIEKLIVSERVPCFTTCHFKIPPSKEYGKRSSANALPGQNMIAFDIDEGWTLDEAMETLSPYTYLIYTTRSHNKDKHGVVCDRFRTLMPTKATFSVDNEKHKEMLQNIAEFLEIPNYDEATRNIDRLWFTNPEGEVIENEGELIDVGSFIPDTHKREKMSVHLNRTGTIDSADADRRYTGMLKWFIANTDEGNRNTNAYKFGTYMLYRLERATWEEDLQYANNMLYSPLDEIEMGKVIQSVLRYGQGD